MNLIQIASGMGNRVSFGALPRSSYIIDQINEILPEDQAIGVLTTGQQFIDIYETLKLTEQNKLARVLEGEHELLLDIVTDLALNEFSDRKRESRAYISKLKMYLTFIGLVLMVNLYSAYTYHQQAVKVIGDDYESTMLVVVKKVFIIVDELIYPPVEKANASSE